jgi:hypothetical protein
MTTSAPLFKTNVADYGTFTKRQPIFYVLGDDEAHRWLVPKLLGDGAQLALLRGSHQQRFYRVTLAR